MQYPSRPNAALVLAAHGSSKNEGSSRPTRRHADALRQRGLFAEVVAAFWKEGPPLGAVLAGVRWPEVYIVPNFISEGYFTRTVLPREFGLEGAVTERGGQRFYYCKPVGSHPSMASALRHRALAALGADADPSGTCLLILGHGTGRDTNSATAIRRQVEAVGALGIFGEVRAAFLDQEPAIVRWRDLTARRDVVAVPFFISNGQHCLKDIPAALGLRGPADPPLDEAAAFAPGPRTLDDRRLWYTPAIGTEPHIADVILDMVEGFGFNSQ
jgi:sirohydrochlorin cobaltochelatase